MAVVLAGAFRHRGVRVCADRIRHVVRRDPQMRTDAKLTKAQCIPASSTAIDYGELLYSLGVMGWLMLVSIPGGLFAFVGWLIFLTLYRGSWRKRASAGVPPPIPPPTVTAS